MTHRKSGITMKSGGSLGSWAMGGHKLSPCVSQWVETSKKKKKKVRAVLERNVVDAQT